VTLVALPQNPALGTRRRPRPRTELTNVRYVKNLQTGKDQIGYAESADGTWTYEWMTDLDGTPWYVTHRPTGLLEAFGDIDSGRRWTASRDPLSLLRAVAEDTIRHEFSPVWEKMRATRALQILDGQLLWAADSPPEARCYCGGYLAQQAGRWLHVDTCADELDIVVTGGPMDVHITKGVVVQWPGLTTWQKRDTPEGCPDDRDTHPAIDVCTACADPRTPCPDGHHAKRVLCTRPEPVQCDHLQCRKPNDIHAGPCEMGHDACCGCYEER
jgi:hypothetical protein